MAINSLPLSDPFFVGFKAYDIEVSDATIRCRVGGAGPPLLLLHGSPQTHVMWRHVALRLQDSFTLVAADLRGYGDSSKPASSGNHEPYSKRAMARDMIEVMSQLGFPRFSIAGHDRGGRVAHRLALDFPNRVSKLAVLDIAPTREMYAGTTDAFARAYWHWFFLIQKAPLPERMILADVAAYLSRNRSIDNGRDPTSEAAAAEYLRCFSDPATVHACCEDYRAAATIDIDHDNADGERLVEMPLLAIWGEQGAVARCFDVISLWKQRARDVTGYGLPAGHNLAEQLPDEVADALRAFFSS